ncbi:MAG: 50S ribosomal protein L15 [Candidatus Aquicultor secundus]|uniref:Large ribosomal subunit protein uL15 n=1 Tax=Candidatus Aquicultor secundus TaxID=1973895 RepID=A0A2M7T9L9_9ACTN|nr:50S ribosomal protein L15 [Candidatus Aquicultor secundus]NCO65252.1 50S ribosomal protein L15 [Solirubrobacter sp.]OIO86241.1 MAG: 50S ribosomal protein L15 [Candidatus Aquicultor secundus]PIU26404.1 MAG: 50S ribosomal protein L15 [Candidatus Aquicultor secundus]PIW22605.1 MAG: 50S ribosomal protein L15 [Candidatus Aquicultor secundus]PIX53130.1 MAG: 50S ribosomal protein L15 [Candidatus Aquicultor secundus]
MRLNELSPAPGAVKKKKRVGRGPGSGHGKTATRGTKGQKSRSGGGKGPGFEGGQTPIYRRLPKLPGFRNPFKKVYELVNIDQLNIFDQGAVVDPVAMQQAGLIKKAMLPVKVLGRGEIEKGLTVKAREFSGSAVRKIEAAGGKVESLK